MIAGWRDAVAVYLRPRLLLILALGFASGLPLALSTATLTFWLAEDGVSKATIGAFALVGTAYTLKFLWSPLIDQLPLPGLTSWLGRRRGWLLLCQAALIVAMLGLGQQQPAADAAAVALWAVALAFASASQDIVIDAYRVEILSDDEQGAGAAMIVFGYRIGMLASGAGALYLASTQPWGTVYAAMAVAMGLGVAATLLAPEPPAPQHARAEGAGLDRALTWLRRAVFEPFAEFLARPGWLAFLAFVVFYKLGDAAASVMTSPLYVELGFSKTEVAEVVKVFGLAATLLGAFLGGALVARTGLVRALWIAGVLQLLSNLGFAGLALAGHDVTVLAAVIGFENLAGGMGTTAFVAFLAALCHREYTATQYALLSSLFAVARTFLAAPGGVLAEQVNWPLYFLLTAIAALPGLLLIVPLRRRLTSSHS
ncbi:MAG: AmpG family muropeptide MFS transporter [Alphaproteobacteria bacterium]|nr:AmpG family muropeptide MFS transporter [Alphaproteobacteria bacterium]MCB9928178.1 AmpG family muropeptide MFS transporter [Alphaproteobacteria bacterium]